MVFLVVLYIFPGLIGYAGVEAYLTMLSYSFPGYNTGDPLTFISITSVFLVIGAQILLKLALVTFMVKFIQCNYEPVENEEDPVGPRQPLLLPSELRKEKHKE